MNNWCSSGLLGYKIWQKPVFKVTHSNSGKFAERSMVVCPLNLRKDKNRRIFTFMRCVTIPGGGGVTAIYGPYRYVPL